MIRTEALSMLYEFVQIARLAAPQHRRRPMLSRPAATLSIMDNLPRLHPGLRIRCPHCRQWHPAIRPYNVGTEYTQCMLFVECRGSRYYVGQEDGTSRRMEMRQP